MRVFSGIQPSGNLTLGNYIGAMRQFVALQHQAQCLFCVVDLHSLTVPQEPAELRCKTLDLAALYLAVGLEPEAVTLFVQSRVSAHAELGWLLQCVGYVGELSRMTQYKDKSKGQESVSVGLFTYPALMAADILLYQTDVVPVGDDQKQHVELTRDLALRFNQRFGETFRVPEVMLRKVGSRIMSLQEPTRKMSKSDPNAANYIALVDPPDVVKRKLARAVTDSEREVDYEPKQRPGISNLVVIYSQLTGEAPESVVARFAGQGYGPFKAALTEVVVEVLRPIQARFAALRSETGELSQLLRLGAERAAATAAPTLRLVQERMGLLGR